MNSYFLFKYPAQPWGSSLAIIRLARVPFVNRKAPSTKRQRKLNQNTVFTQKTHQTVFVHSTPERFENPTIIDHFEFGDREITTDYRDAISKSCVLKMFPVLTKSRRFQIPPNWGAFSKLILGFVDRVAGRPDCRSKVTFFISPAWFRGQVLIKARTRN